MTMNKKKIVIIIGMLLVVSCNRSPLKNIFKQEVLDSVRSYIEKDNLAHDSYLMLQTEKIFHENKIDINNGFIIGPLYENLYPDSERGNYIELLKYKNKTVYIQFFNASFIDSLYHARTVIYCRQDSFCIYKNVYSHNPIMIRKGNCLSEMILTVYICLNSLLITLNESAVTKINKGTE